MLEGNWQEQVEAAAPAAVVPATLREAAAQSFSEKGFPTPRLEDWKYTNIAPIARSAFTVNAEATTEKAVALLQSARIPLDAIGMIAVINGRVDWSLSLLDTLPQGLRVYSLNQRAEITDETDRRRIEQKLGSLTPVADEALVALHTACGRDGVAVLIDEGTVLDQPLVVVAVSTADDDGSGGAKPALYPRMLVDAAANSTFCMLETFVGSEDTAYFNNAVAEFFVAEKVVLTHYRMQQEGNAAYHVSAIDAVIEANSHFETCCFSFGGSLVRNDIRVRLAGEQSHAAMNGLSVLDATQHVDNTTVLDHAVPNCTSHELYKGIYGAQSRGVFSGTIIVREDAQKTNAFQSNQALLLSRDAEINSRPQLKIWADDVKCSHGATVGQLDDDQLFYLMARGIAKDVARDMLIHGFAEGLLEQVRSDSVRELLEVALLAKLRNIPSEI